MADLSWNSVNANFNDVNSAMGNSIIGISQAGTIFGELRKSILDEEQRAVDNAFREKQFNEQVSQFAATHGLDENKLKEQIRHNQESERLTGVGHDVQRRGQDISESNNIRSNNTSRYNTDVNYQSVLDRIQADAPLNEQQTIAAQLGNSNTRDTREAQDAAENANIYLNLPVNDRQVVNKQMQEQMTALQQSIPNIADPIERISAERQLSRMQAQYKILTDPFTSETLTANERANRINSVSSLFTGQNFDATRAASELELGQTLQTRQDDFEKGANQSLASARNGLFAADQELVNQATQIGRRMATHDGKLDWNEYNRFLAQLQNPHTTADGKKVYDERGVDLWGMTARETANTLKEYINSDGTKGSLAGVHAANEQSIMKERAAIQAQEIQAAEDQARANQIKLEKKQVEALADQYTDVIPGMPTSWLERSKMPKSDLQELQALEDRFGINRGYADMHVRKGRIQEMYKSPEFQALYNRITKPGTLWGRNYRY